MAAAVKKTAAPKAPKLPRVEFYKDRKKEYRWRAIARNGNTVADSGEGYEKLAACKRGWKATRMTLFNEWVVR